MNCIVYVSPGGYICTGIQISKLQFDARRRKKMVNSSRDENEGTYCCIREGGGRPAM